MTVAVFVFSLLAAMALGMPIAYALLVCGVVILLLAPFLVAFTFYIFDFQLWQKAAMAVRWPRI